MSVENITHASSSCCLLTPGQDPLITDDARALVETALNVLIFNLCSLGMVTNAINIRVFSHQGISSDSNTVGLFALAVADFAGCMFMIAIFVCDVMKYAATPAMRFSCVSVSSVALNIPHNVMASVTRWITVYLAIERCLCVLLPFKVKMFLRPRVAAVAMVTIYAIFFGANIPLLYVSFELKWLLNQSLNSSVITIIQLPMAEEIFKYSGLIQNTVTHNIAISIVTIATALMIYKLNSYKKWRQKTVSTRNTQTSSGSNTDSKPKDRMPGKKDVETLKIVTMVTGLFVVCISLSGIPGIITSVVPGVTFEGYNRNLLHVMYQFKFILDLVNSSLNFFFYIRISSRYKTAFSEVFRGQNMPAKL